MYPLKICNAPRLIKINTFPWLVDSTFAICSEKCKVQKTSLKEAKFPPHTTHLPQDISCHSSRQRARKTDISSTNRYPQTYIWASSFMFQPLSLGQVAPSAHWIIDWRFQMWDRCTSEGKCLPQWVNETQFSSHTTHNTVAITSDLPPLRLMTERAEINRKGIRGVKRITTPMCNNSQF